MTDLRSGERRLGGRSLSSRGSCPLLYDGGVEKRTWGGGEEEREAERDEGDEILKKEENRI